jgi:hypothetical protein
VRWLRSAAATCVSSSTSTAVRGACIAYLPPLRYNAKAAWTTLN